MNAGIMDLVMDVHRITMQLAELNQIFTPDPRTTGAAIPDGLKDNLEQWDTVKEHLVGSIIRLRDALKSQRQVLVKDLYDLSFHPNYHIQRVAANEYARRKTEQGL